MATYSDRPADVRLAQIRLHMEQQEAHDLSPHACWSRNAVRRRREARLETDYRKPYSVDVDRILHSHAYTRYIDKTQVFYLVRNDHITHRVLHVQLVSKIARTIGRFLSLNEDLIEAIALGHDIGHTPFGHDGETFLSELCRSAGIGDFHHNLQSVQFLEKVERKGRGWNLTLQSLDGILCHDGEVHDPVLEPRAEKDFRSLEAEIELKKNDAVAVLKPMTMEGCVVRMADTIAYIGRDIEDAIRLHIVRRTDLPQSCVKVLGDTNGTIVYNLVTDVIRNSYGRPYVRFSREVSDAVRRLKRFNLERIYMNPKIKQQTHKLKELFGILFHRYCDDIAGGNVDSPIFKDFLSDKSAAYRNAHTTAEMVRDFIAGMTDRFFLRQCPEHLRPGTLDL